MAVPSKITKTLYLEQLDERIGETKKLTRSDKKTLKELIGQTAVELVKENTGKSKSSVASGSFKKTLNKEYAKEMKRGNRQANLRLYGDMLGSLKHKNVVDGVQIGIYKKKEANKADGHCNYSGKSTLPERRFTPDEEHNFNKAIMKELKKVAQDFVDDVAVDVGSSRGLARALATAAAKEAL